MDEVFTSAFVRHDAHVLGVRLSPLSLGHVMLLYHIESPFVTGATWTLSDLAQAVWICSKKYSQIDVAIDPKRILKEVHRWGRACKKMDYAAEAEKFKAYLTHYLQAPENWHHAGDKKPAAPWPCAIAWTLMEIGNVDEEKVWDMPVNRAMVAYACCGDAHGSPVVTPEEKKIIDELEEEPDE